MGQIKKDCKLHFSINSTYRGTLQQTRVINDYSKLVDTVNDETYPGYFYETGYYINTLSSK